MLFNFDSEYILPSTVQNYFFKVISVTLNLAQKIITFHIHDL